ncbi:hypothetical protein C2G38_1972101, partial [Gigaspora rosea]
LLHIATSICNTGHAWSTWQYPMERLCGMLLPLVCSQQHPYTNLRNQITLWNQFSLLQYKAEINKKLFIKDLEDIPNHSESRVLVIEGIEERLFSLSSSYNMNKTKIQHLRAYYAMALDRPINQLKVYCLSDLFYYKKFNFSHIYIF